MARVLASLSLGLKPRAPCKPRGHPFLRLPGSCERASAPLWAPSTARRACPDQAVFSMDSLPQRLYPLPAKEEPGVMRKGRNVHRELFKPLKQTYYQAHTHREFQSNYRLMRSVRG
ncbi:unnamed protein product [Rangifer tarandus platyrhynchus]|uniref:Uncharacterized protein n=1 Tax=Rangifer tarandus platyrhynchus TaxID=3082113 RepID=A0AC60A1L5_RANTA